MRKKKRQAQRKLPELPEHLANRETVYEVAGDEVDTCHAATEILHHTDPRAVVARFDKRNSFIGFQYLPQAYAKVLARAIHYDKLLDLRLKTEDKAKVDKIDTALSKMDKQDAKRANNNTNKKRKKTK